MYTLFTYLEIEKRGGAHGARTIRIHNVSDLTFESENRRQKSGSGYQNMKCIQNGHFLYAHDWRGLRACVETQQIYA